MVLWGPLWDSCVNQFSLENLEGSGARKIQTGGSYCSFLPPQSGKKQLPDAGVLSRRFLLRRKFIPDPQGTNLMFAFFAQHFTHQFFKTSGKMGPGFTKALGHGVST